MKKNMRIIIMTFIFSALSALCVTACGNNSDIPASPAMPASHTHNWSNEWQRNETHHWHNCTASGCTVKSNSQKSGYAAHSYNSIGYCVCGKEKPAQGSDDKPLHTHSWSNEWQKDETHHWHNCTASGCTVTENSQKSGYAAHNFDTTGVCICGERKVVATALYLDKESATIFVDDELTLTVSVFPANAQVDFTWMSADTSVATVSQTGTVNAVSVGTTKIIVSAPNGINAVCNITVKENTYGLTFTKHINIADSYVVAGYTGSASKVRIPSTYDGCPVIGIKSLSGSKTLRNVIIPSSIEIIGDYAFRNCENLESVEIPSSVQIIGFGAFSGCRGLKSLSLPFIGYQSETAKSDFQYPLGYIFGTTYYNGCYEAQQKYISLYEFRTDTFCIPSSLTDITVTGGHILSGALMNCNSLTHLTIENNVASIATDSMSGCDINNAVVPAFAVPCIPKDNFQTVEITSGNIEGETFKACSRLERISISDNVINIDKSGFADCEKLQSITVASNNGNYSSQDRVLYNKAKTEIIYAPQAITGNVTIPSGVTSIGPSVFSGCSNLTSIEIPNRESICDLHPAISC